MAKWAVRNDPHANARIMRAGADLAKAKAAGVFLHGRGASAESILELARIIGAPEMASLAPQAEGNTWYPYSFLEPIERNEPYLTSALACVGRVVALATKAGIPNERVALIGFSQGGCLALEYAVRNPGCCGVVVGLSSGLIGPAGTEWNSEGSLKGTAALLGCSDVDFHIPVGRVHESARALELLGADVTERIYPGMGHSVNDEEIAIARTMLHRMSEDAQR